MQVKILTAQHSPVPVCQLQDGQFGVEEGCGDLWLRHSREQFVCFVRNNTPVSFTLEEVGGDCYHVHVLAKGTKIEITI